jgi:hypothetical protein
MYKFMNLWKIIEGWTFFRGYPLIKFFKPNMTEILRENFSSFAGVQARLVNRLLPIGHRWRGDVGIESEVSNEKV